MPLYNYGDIVSMSVAQSERIDVVAGSGGGATFTVTIAGRVFNYDAPAGQTQTQVATGLEAFLVQAQTIVQVARSGAVLFLTGALGVAFAVSVGAGMTRSTTQAAIMGRIRDPMRVLKSREIWTKGADGEAIPLTLMKVHRIIQGPIDESVLSTLSDIDITSDEIRTVIALRQNTP